MRKKHSHLDLRKWHRIHYCRIMELSGKDAKFIAYLSDFLRANGNEVLVGKKKLSLTSSVLCILNKLYSDTNSSIVNKASNGSQLRENWNFLLNVINNVAALKVTHCVETVQGGINLSIFKSLLMLELKKTPIHLLLGLSEFCSQLEVLICSCSISSLHELITNKTVFTEWTAMKQLNLAHNYLEKLEEDIQLFPNLQIIDVSHNRLINANALRFLSKLCSVNLGYNNLSRVPTFSNESYNCLKELSLRNNNLEDLNGLENVRHIQDLDLSYNLLTEHSVLCPVQNLPFLQVLKLEGNPFTVQHLHRILTAKHFHPNVLTFGIKLDGYKLTKTEIGKVIQVRSISRHRICNDNVSGNRIQINSPLQESRVNSLENVGVLPVMIPSLSSSSSLDNASAANELLLKDDTSSITSVCSDTVRKRKSKTKKRKEIIIQDSGRSQQPNPNYNFSEKKECTVQELKAAIIARREHLGQDWLISTSLPADDILSTMNATSLTNRLDPLKRMTEHQNISCSHRSNCDEERLVSTKATNMPNKGIRELEKNQCSKEAVNNTGEKVMKKISVASDDIEVICSDHVHQGEIINDGFSVCKSCMQSEQEESEEDDNFQDNKNEYDIKYGIIEDEVFLVEKKVGENITTTIFISIYEKYLNEIDVLSRALLDSLDLSVLDSAQILEKNIIKLEFKIFNVSKRERMYYAENEVAAKEILSLLLPHAEARNLANIVKNALKCIKCDAQFTRDILKQRFLSDNNHPLAKYLLSGNSLLKTEFEDKDVCPVCESLMIVEDNDCPVTPTLLQKANYSPTSISGYLFAPQSTLTSPASTGLPPNLLLTFKPLPKVKQDVSSVLDKAAVDPACHGDTVNNSESDDSSVCTALEYTSQELAGNGSNNSFDLVHADDNLNLCAKHLPSLTKTSEETHLKHEENEQPNMPKTSTPKGITTFDMQMQKTELLNMLDNTAEITYDTFINMNHTLKLYIEMKLFDANEELEAFAEAIIVSHSTTVKNKGLLLLSNKKIHFMKLENLHDEPEKNITPLEAFGLNQLNTVLMFIGNQGASFICGTERNPTESKACYTCLFRDADYCCSFITYFADFIKQKHCPLLAINSSSEDSLNQIKQVLLAKTQNGKPLTSDISTEILAFILVEWCWLEASEKEYESVALILTSTDICVTKIIFTKQNNKSVKFSKPVEQYIPIAQQKVTNLISVHPYFDSYKVGLHFLDEDSNKELSWVIEAKTKQTLCLLINTLKEPWQENFGVEMTLETPVDCKCNT